MTNQKIGNQLNLSLSLPVNEREKSDFLSTGFNEVTNTWEIIVKYNGDLSVIQDDVISIDRLTNQYAIVVVPEQNISKLANYSQIEFIEKPKQLAFELQESKRAACITPVQIGFPNLSGEGVLLGIIDSGIDYRHPDFINEDGTTRIVSILKINDALNLDNPSIEYTREQINEALRQPTETEALAIVPTIDVIGHGTHVAGIAGGNGRGSNGQYRGVAYESEFIIVQLSETGAQPFVKTTELMKGIAYVVNTAQALNKPVAINISYGNNYGSHDGSSLLETFIDDMSNVWKNVIVIGAGNEGAAAHHYENTIEEDETQVVEIAVSNSEKDVYIQLWKSYSDDFLIEVEAPNGQKSGFIKPLLGTQQFNLMQTQVAVFFGEPSPYNNDQEIYFQLIPNQEFIAEGTWKINIQGVKIVRGTYNLWLPTASTLNLYTRFLQPETRTTLTVPSTATNVITVGGYNQGINSIASFSGRGYTREINLIKPNLVAPAVDIMSAVPGGGYDTKTGTSMATPFVTGASALLMQWGIVQGNDPFLYGEKVKAFLQKSARRDESLRSYPNPDWGYGSLCLENVFENGVSAVISTNTVSINELENTNNQVDASTITTIGENCKEAIISSDYIDLIIEYTDTLDEIINRYDPDCIQIIDDQFAILHIKVEDCAEQIQSEGFGYRSLFPALIGPYGKSALSSSGILTFHTQPYVPLRGQNTLIGIVDSGIDYTHKVFTYEDNTTKIMYLWDQTIQGNPPENFEYGTEYSSEDINRALASSNPLEVVPSTDTSGHGTFLAGAAAGREDQQADFIGAAPDADLIVVKLKQAKQCLMDYYIINNQEQDIYQSTDLILGVKYLAEKSKELGRPISIIIGLGSNNSSHDGSSMTETFLLNVAKRRGNVVTVAAGNEANKGHHYYNFFLPNEASKNVEINVAKDEEGFILSIWNHAPDKMSIAITSPTGEYIDKIPARLQQAQDIKLVLEETTIYVEYQLFEERTGDQHIIVRMEKPTEGIWTITIFGDLIVDGRVDVWLPREGFIKEETVFLMPDPYITVTFPSTSIGLITTGAYNHQSGSLYLSSGRGLTRDVELKPDLVAPGVNVIGPLPGNRFGTMTGTSVSAAITAGAGALLLEWGIVLGNDRNMYTEKVLTYLIRGATRRDNIIYPNREWGYGALNLLGTFEGLKG
ncbi:MAG: hypothetical protein CVU84_10950 [Firmicutes bacterium HGW-Firmicutes-1]|jgi:subtilisin family serine protease|nr:MAG: hypothetical protein CVU84_10950 [Firmicutes bacterium HGW-Firmicutes-1]